VEEEKTHIDPFLYTQEWLIECIRVKKEALQTLLARAREQADCDRPIEGRNWESEDAISISALEKIVKEMLA